MKQLSILMTSDTHGYWLDIPGKANLSLRQTVATMKRLKAEINHPTIAIDLGDFIQGSSFATYCSQIAGDGQVFARAMNEVGYDLHVIGNHEFNFGFDYRNRILEQLQAPIVSSNIVSSDNEEPIFDAPYLLMEVDGIKVGIIGVTTHYIPNWELPEHYAGITFKDAFETTQYYARLLRPDVDVLVVAYHGGYESDLDTFEPLEDHTGENQGARMLQEIPEIDVLLTGHQHRHINQKVGTAWTVQPGFAGEYVAEVQLTLEEKQITAMSGKLHEAGATPADDSFNQVLMPELAEGEAWLKDVIGNAPLQSVTSDVLKARVYGHPYVELLNQLQLKETGADFSAIALINDSFSKFSGPITNELLLETYPYYNRIAKVAVTGQDLHEVMEYNLEYLLQDKQGEIGVNPEYIYPKPRHYNYDLYSGLQMTADLTQPIGQRVQSLVNEATNEPIDKAQTYTLALSQYRAVGGGDFKTFTPDKIIQISATDIATLLREALVAYTSEDWHKINECYRHVEWV